MLRTTRIFKRRSEDMFDDVSRWKILFGKNCSWKHFRIERNYMQDEGKEFAVSETNIVLK